MRSKYDPGVSRITSRALPPPHITVAMLLCSLTTYAARAQPCPVAPASVAYEGDASPLQSRHFWIAEGNPSYSPGPEDGTARISGGSYVNLSEFFGDSSLGWIRISARVRIDGYELFEESTGASIAAATPDKVFGFHFLEQDGVQKVAPDKSKLGTTGLYESVLPAVVFSFADGLFHEYEYLLNIAAGTYRGTIDGTEVFSGPIDELPRRSTDSGGINEAPGAFTLTAGSGGDLGQADMVVDYARHEACLADCAARAQGALDFEGDSTPSPDVWPPWILTSADADVEESATDGIYTLGVSPQGEEPAMASGLWPVFSEFGRQMELSVRMRQTTSAPGPLAQPWVGLGFGYFQHDRRVMVGLLDRGSGQRSVSLDSGEFELVGDVSEEFVVDWTEFHDYRIVENAEDPFVRLFVDGAEAARLPRGGLPGNPGEPVEGIFVNVMAVGSAIDSDWDHIRADFRRDGFEEICDGVDNDCNGKIDDVGEDPDGDEVGHYCDNCPSRANPGQEDSDGDGIGDACELGGTCGNGVVDMKPPGPPPPPCAVSGSWTMVRSRADLDAWLADPTTSVKIKKMIDLEGGDLALVTSCMVSVDGPGSLVDVDNLLITGSTIDLHDDVKATGRVELRATEEVVLRNPAQLYGAPTEIVIEAPLVTIKGDLAVSELLCVEADTIDMYKSVYEVAGAGILLSTTGSFYLEGELVGASGLLVQSNGDVLLDTDARLADIDKLGIVSGGALSLAGRIEGCGEVGVQADSLGISGSASLSQNGQVDVSVNRLFSSQGAVSDNEQVTICTTEYLLYSGHDFNGNWACQLGGNALPGSEAALGCVESGPCAAPPPATHLASLPASGDAKPLHCGATDGCGLLAALLLLLGLAVRGRI